MTYNEIWNGAFSMSMSTTLICKNNESSHDPTYLDIHFHRSQFSDKWTHTHSSRPRRVSRKKRSIHCMFHRIAVLLVARRIPYLMQHRVLDAGDERRVVLLIDIVSESLRIAKFIFGATSATRKRHVEIAWASNRS